MRTLVLAAAVALVGCNMNRFTANTTAGVFEEAAPAFHEHWDYDFAGQAAPGNLMQLEGFLRIVPDNETLLLELAKGYTGYAYGWVEDELERTDPADFERQEAVRARARRFYLHARDLAFRWLAERDDGVTKARAGAAPAFEKFLNEHFGEKDDAPGLFWAGYAWGSAINLSREDPELIADLAYARALVARSVALDRDYFHASGLVFLAVLKADFPAALGGDPAGGKALFEEALVRTKRNFHLIQVNYARTYAVQTADRALYQRLLMEVIEAGDASHAARLMNKIARRRAARYLEQADEYF